MTDPFPHSLTDWLAGQEDARAEAWRRFRNRRVGAIGLYALLAVLTVGGALTGQVPVSDGAILFAAFFTFAAFLLGWNWVNVPLKTFHARLKAQVLPALAEARGFDYSPTGDPVEIVGDHARLGLVPHHTRGHVEDVFQGIHKGVELGFAEATLTRRRRGDRAKQTAFRGLLVTLALPRRVPGRTVLLPDLGLLNVVRRVERDLGREIEAVEIDDPAFERAFQAFATQPKATRKLLTETVRAGLLALTEYDGRPVKVAAGLYGDRVYLAIDLRRDLFEVTAPDDGTPLAACVAPMNAEIDALLALVDLLGLGTAPA